VTQESASPDPVLERLLAELTEDERSRVVQTYNYGKSVMNKVWLLRYIAWLVGALIVLVGLVVLLLDASRDDFRHHPEILYGAGLSVTAYYLLLILTVVPSSRRRAVTQYVALRRLLRTLVWLDMAFPPAPEAPSPPATASRVMLARLLLKCADAMYKFSPRVVRKLDGKILQGEAIRAAQVFRDLVRPALLGGDEAHALIRDTLMKAVLCIGTWSWVRVGDLNVGAGSEVSRSSRRDAWAAQAWPITMAVLTAIPAIPVLLVYLT
jgi:hypothetical protein